METISDSLNKIVSIVINASALVAAVATVPMAFVELIKKPPI
jgi:hypothetical protein